MHIYLTNLIQSDAVNLRLAVPFHYHEGEPGFMKQWEDARAAIRNATDKRIGLISFKKDPLVLEIEKFKAFIFQDTELDKYYIVSPVKLAGCGEPIVKC
ncbi:TPA: hypothetical protein OGS62_004006 [Escherichia coli]|uniref:hypothetical protein n=1 Tax=Escherichia coli TaxID=562 RepID=UPI000BDE8648|nr:hypothetical protein [Escherichia coli]EEQ3776135.1 hypothetical protein [Escherichia coli]EEU0149577.1 hypothetical protein [Escherichia coli]EEU0690433.1 hypothetical protein [Escherichia coli]EEU4315178.1 hypothetical protein [Escherichia coli]EFM3805850.1 hypothetical protein [Escherichia coli]